MVHTIVLSQSTLTHTRWIDRLVPSAFILGIWGKCVGKDLKDKVTKLGRVVDPEVNLFPRPC